MPAGLAIIPLGHAQLDRLASDRAFNRRDGFIYLSEELEAGILRRAGDERLLYLETEYFGGIGDQGAALSEQGAVVWRAAHASDQPKAGRSPISEGLSRLGVPPAPGSDEFDGAGLGRFRSMETLGLAEDDED